MNDPDQPNDDQQVQVGLSVGHASAPKDDESLSQGPTTPPKPRFTAIPYAGGGFIFKDSEDLDDVESIEFGFADKSIRKGFIRKLYSTLAVQLSVCSVVIAIFVFYTPTNQWVSRHPNLWWILLIVLFATMILMFLCETIRRKSPMNFIFLALFTVVQSFLLSTVPETEEAFFAVLLTVAVCIGLTIFAFQSRWHFTIMGVVLFVAVIILMIFGIIVRFIFGIIGALIFCGYMISDTHLMTDDSYTYSITPEDYIFAALNLYLDVFNIFIYFWNIVRDRIYPHRYERSVS